MFKAILLGFVFLLSFSFTSCSQKGNNPPVKKGDTTAFKKEFEKLLVKYGFNKNGYSLNVTSNNQNGGQTAFIITNNYYGDTSRMFAVGKISEEAQNLINTAKQCLDQAIEVVKPNAKFKTIAEVITSLAENQNYSVVSQFVGHGVGIHFHEPPHVHHNVRNTHTSEPMKPGMIFTIEPMINSGKETVFIDQTDYWTVKTADNSLSAQFEHTILVTEKGYEILTIN